MYLTLVCELVEGKESIVASPCGDGTLVLCREESLNPNHTSLVCELGEGKESIVAQSLWY